MNRTILITGSSRGIGKATAELAHKSGYKVILHGKTDSKELNQVQASLSGSEKIVFNVVDEKSVKSEIQKLLKKIKTIDTVVNCAGATNSRKFLELSDEDWRDAFEINVLGTVHVCKSILPIMQKAGKGRVVNIASVRGYGITSGRAAYSASKAGIINLTAVLAREFAPDILVNAVAPGFTETDMSKTWNERVWQQVNSALLGRIAQPEEIAEAILFLGGPKNTFITGQTLLVDGGFSLK